MLIIKNVEKMDNPKISVIVPVYNVERYLRRCIDSILAQTFTDFELLLIDDGSKDSSGEICDEYAAKDSRIIVFHKENGGVSSARNVGLDNVRGEWVAFVDADDKISDGYFHICEEHENADVVVKPFYIIKEKEKKYYGNKVKVIDSREDIFRYFVRKRVHALWDAIFKKSLITSKRFNTDVSIGEDYLFFLSVLPNVKSLAFDSKGPYHYFVRQGSAMQATEERRMISILWENIINVKNLTEADDMKVLQKGIIYKSHVYLLYLYRNGLNLDEKCRLKKIFKEMNISDLLYVDIKTKIKLVLCKYLVQLHIFS